MPACEGANASIIKFSKENALKVYSKRLKNSDKIKKDFVKDMELAEGLRKEESEKMEDKEKEVVETVEEEVKETPVEGTEEVKETEEFAKEVSDDETYMEEDESEKEEDDKDDEEKSDEESDEKEDEEDDKNDEEDMECNKDFESLTVEQKYEVFRSAVKESLNGCWYLETYDDEYLYVYDYALISYEEVTVNGVRLFDNYESFEDYLNK